jgi:adhesin transport system outer membrane protein
MNRTLKQITFSTTMLAAMLFTAQPLVAQTLTEAVTTTIKSNPLILAESYRSLSVDQTIGQAEAGYFPQVDLTMGTGRERSDNPQTRVNNEDRKWLDRGESGITASQMIYDGFATKNSVDQTKSLAESAGYSVADTTETISLRTIQVYLEVIRRQELLKVTEDNLESNERVFSQIKLRADSGVGTKADVEQSSGRVALSKANNKANIGNLVDAKTTFLREVGEPADSLVEPTEDCCSNAPATLEDAINIAYHQHPAIRAALSQHEASLAQQQGAVAPMHPRVDLELAASANNDLEGVEGHNNDRLVMVRLRYNLLNGGADSAFIDQTGFISEQVKYEANLAQRVIEQDVRLAWNELQRQTNRLEFLQLRVKSTEETREAYQLQFSLGQRTLLDLLDTENEVLTARSELINGHYDRLYACYWLTETTGKLLETLKLEAPAEAITVESPLQMDKVSSIN